MNNKKKAYSRRSDQSLSLDKKDQNDLRDPLAGDIPLTEVVDDLTREGTLYKKIDEEKLECYACAHRCKIRPGLRGICQVRFNSGGKLFVPWGYVGAMQCDPTEKKPFFHVFPGSDTLTFGMLGCDLHCSYCQNWDTSQALRDAAAGQIPTQISIEQLIMLAKANHAKCFASSYNEPLITAEWSAAIFKEAQKEGFTCMFVSNGNATPEVLEHIRPFTEAYKIDLKSMNDRNYRKLGTRLESVLEGIRMVYQLGFWTEIVTLIVPGFNDSEQEIRDTARFIKSVSADIPWHVTAFHKDYKMTRPDNTDAGRLIRAAEIGYQEGLNYVYAGNLPGYVDKFEHTFCPACNELLIKRIGYVVLDYRITGGGTCPNCDSRIQGIWPDSARQVRTGSVDDLYYRMPRMVR